VWVLEGVQHPGCLGEGAVQRGRVAAERARSRRGAGRILDQRCAVVANRAHHRVPARAQLAGNAGDGVPVATDRRHGQRRARSVSVARGRIARSSRTRCAPGRLRAAPDPLDHTSSTARPADGTSRARRSPGRERPPAPHTGGSQSPFSVIPTSTWSSGLTSPAPSTRKPGSPSCRIVVESINVRG
jgi:hypothetical protein